MLVDLSGFSTELTCDFPSTSNTICLDDTQSILDELSDGDYTYLRISNDFVYEVIKVTREGDNLVVERGQCQDNGCEPELLDFVEGDCADYYSNAFECDNSSPEEDCPVTLDSSDNSIHIEETNNCSFDLRLNLDALPDFKDELCELGEGTLLAKDYVIALRKNGDSCSLHLVSISDLCERLGDC